jgi:hypothetical protein
MHLREKTWSYMHLVQSFNRRVSEAEAYEFQNENLGVLRKFPSMTNHCCFVTD